MSSDQFGHIIGKPAPNPHTARNERRMKKKRCTWFFVSKTPLYMWGLKGSPDFSGSFTPGVTYKRENPKPLSKKYRRWFKKHHG